jgi:hypothetical protein
MSCCEKTCLTLQFVSYWCEAVSTADGTSQLLAAGSDPVTFLASITPALIGARVAPVADRAGIHAAPISKLDIKAAAVVLTIFIWFS